VVSGELLEELAAEAPQDETPAGEGDSTGPRLDVARWLTDRGQKFRRKDKPDDKGRTHYVLAACPFNPEHADPDSGVRQGADGKLSAQCFHNTCRGKGWQEFKATIGEPDEDHWQRRKGKVLWGDPPANGQQKKTTPKLVTQVAENIVEEDVLWL